MHHEAGAFWWAAVPMEEWPQDVSWVKWLVFVRDPVCGDRRQEIVFIGIALDEAALRRRLDACILTVEEARSLRGKAIASLDRSSWTPR